MMEVDPKTYTDMINRGLAYAAKVGYATGGLRYVRDFMKPPKEIADKLAQILEELEKQIE